MYSFQGLFGPRVFLSLDTALEIAKDSATAKYDVDPNDWFWELDLELLELGIEKYFLKLIMTEEDWEAEDADEIAAQTLISVTRIEVE
jgi:hypothetical protein